MNDWTLGEDASHRWREEVLRESLERASAEARQSRYRAAVTEMKPLADTSLGAFRAKLAGEDVGPVYERQIDARLAECVRLAREVLLLHELKAKANGHNDNGRGRGPGAETYT